MPGNPVAMFYFSLSLYVILASGKIPHEISPVHVVQLVDKEERCYPIGSGLSPSPSVRTGRREPARPLSAQPVFVGLCVCVAVHAREEHILCILVIGLMTHYFSCPFHRGVAFSFRWYTGAPSVTSYTHIRPLLSVPVWRRMSVRRTKDGFHIVLAGKVFSLKWNVFGEFWSIGVLAVERITIKGVRGVSYHNHHDAQQRGI